MPPKRPRRVWGVLMPLAIGVVLAILQVYISLQTPQEMPTPDKPMVAAPTNSTNASLPQMGTHLLNKSTNKSQMGPHEQEIPNSTLALVDPRLMGGFRNQYMRLEGLVMHAVQSGIPNLLLESLQWDNSVLRVAPDQKQQIRIPFDVLFDVHGWNAVSEEVGTDVLPRLVPYSPQKHIDWDPMVQLFSNLSGFVATAPLAILRKLDLMDNTTDCEEPYAFGSSPIKNRKGRLWNAYEAFQKKRRPGDMFDRTDRAMARALRPSEALSEAVSHLLHRHRRQANNTIPSISGGLLVIHPRCEIDMLAHRCSRHMVKNLTRVLEMIEQSPHMNQGGSGQHNDTTNVGNANQTTLKSNVPRYNQAYLCISRHFMELKDDPRYIKKKVIADDNLETLNRVTGTGMWDGQVPLREGGEHFTSNLTGTLSSKHVSGMAAQVLNFFLAVEADTFVGTFGSSWSNDVWMVRYMLGKGEGNYYHHPNGVHPVPNGGEPPPHHC